ncbi:hypothetical protein RSAG8_03235, partial [Rhizoctonia solani AG-8 WAC10335]
MGSIIQKEIIVKDDPRQPECHASTLVVVRDYVLAAWFGGEKEGRPDVKIWLSRRSRTGEWSQPRVVVAEDGITHWNPVLFTPDPTKTPDRVILFYKAGTPIPRWKTWMIESTDGGETWSPRQELVPGDESGGRGPVKNPVIVLANGDWASGASVEVTLPNGEGVWDSFRRELDARVSFSRGVADVSHVVTAVASRSLFHGQEWIQETCPDYASAIKVYGTYEELLRDPQIDIIYIGTPHSHHFQHARDCLNAGKHVLCEKAFTVNAAQARALKALAKSKNLFLMEAVWRHIVPTCQVRAAGPAGGTLHDLFPYPLFWALVTLYHLPTNELTPPSHIAASSTLHPKTGVDIQTTDILSFSKIGAQAILSSSLEVPTPRDQVVLIQGTKGDLVVPLIPPGRPTMYYVRVRKEKRNAEYDETVKTFDIPGHSLFWEADECARCLARGQIESSRMPLDESILVMEILDEIRSRRVSGFQLTSRVRHEPIESAGRVFERSGWGVCAIIYVF